MLSARKLGYRYPESRDQALAGIDLDLKAGDRILLQGRNGSGKTTLLRILSGLIDPTDGTLSFQYSDDQPAVGFVPQNPEAWMLASTVEEEIAFALENQGLLSAMIAERVEIALEAVGIQHLRKRNPAHLSGGEMQRTLIACLHALQPSVWLLDEPTAFLDPYAKQQVMELLTGIPREAAVVMAASSSDQLPGQTECYGIVNGCLERSSEIDVFEKSPLEEAPPESISGIAGMKALYSGLFETQVRMQAEVSHATALRKELFGESRKVIDQLDLTLEGGEITALLGRSGAGKSTLLETLAGTLKPESGKVAWNGNTPGTMRGKLGFAFQFPERTFFSETVLEEVAWGPINLGLSKPDAYNQARKALRVVGLDPDVFESRSPFALSRGEARRVALAAVWSLRPVAWLVDEPTSGLDPEGCVQIGAMLRAEADRGCVVLIAGHDTEHLAVWADRLLLLDNGRVTADGTSQSWWGDQGNDPWPRPGTCK